MRCPIKLGNMLSADVKFQLTPRPIPMKRGISVRGPRIHHAPPYSIEETVVGQITDDYHNAAVDEKTKSLLAFAEKLTRNAYKVTDENVQTLRDQGWSDRQILEATLIAGHSNPGPKRHKTLQPMA